MVTVPAALPSIRTSRGSTTTASAMAGLVRAMRVTSKSVVNTVERPTVRVTRAVATLWSWGASTCVRATSPIEANRTATNRQTARDETRARRNAALATRILSHLTVSSVRRAPRIASTVYGFGGGGGGGGATTSGAITTGRGRAGRFAGGSCGGAAPPNKFAVLIGVVDVGSASSGFRSVSIS